MKTKTKILNLWLLVAPSAVLADSGGAAPSLQNPLSKWGIDNLGDLVITLINLAIMFAGIVAVLVIIVAGYQMMTAGDKKDQVELSKNRLKWAVAGLGLVLLAKVIVTIVVNFVGLEI